MFKGNSTSFNEKILISRLLQTNEFREDKFSRAIIILNKTVVKKLY
jgi:hypothetical protein